MPKLYTSKVWLRKRYVIDRKTPEQIAEECGTNPRTIYRYLHEFGLMK